MSARALVMSLWVAWAAMTAAATGCGHGAPVMSPLTIQSAGRPPQQTEQAILEALPKRGWTAENVQPGRVLAFLSIRKFLLRTEIRYDANTVNVFYVDSDQLQAHVGSDGRVYAHPKVNAWIQNLARDISASLAMGPAMGVSAGPPPGYYQQPPVQSQGQPGPVAPAPTGIAAPAQPLAN